MMLSRLRVLLPILFTLIAAPSFGTPETTGRLATLFASEADIYVSGEGLARLALPPDVLSACRPNLSDLRIFDHVGNEVPYAIDSGPKFDRRIEQVRSVPAEIIEVYRETGPKSSQIAEKRLERFEISTPQGPPPPKGWVLVIGTKANRFSRRVRIDGIQEGGTKTSLGDEQSIFRLPSGSARVEKMRLRLPSFRGDKLIVTIEGSEDFYIEPSFRFESSRLFEPGTRLTVPLEIISRESADGRTLIVLSRPSGFVPSILRLDTETGTFDRTVSIWDQRQGSRDRLLGRGKLFRVKTASRVHQDLEIRLNPARGDRLRIEVDDRSSPMLHGMVFSAVVRGPALIFELPPAAEGSPTGTLRFGGGRAHLPHYDIARLLPKKPAGLSGKRARAAALLYEGSSFGRARLGTVRANPRLDARPALAFAMRPGATVSPKQFSHRRRVTVPPAPEGLSRIRLAPEDIARTRADLADVRLVDNADRQWPYLLVRDAATIEEDLSVQGPVSKDYESHYRLILEEVPARVSALILETDDAFFDRAFLLKATIGDDQETVLSRGRLRRRDGDMRALPIRFKPHRIESLELVIEDGDDAALRFKEARAEMPLPDIFITAPEGDYFLLLGAPQTGAPRYDLERVRDLILAVESRPVAAGSLEENPRYSLRAKLGSGQAQFQILLWSVLAFAVVALATLTLRLARREAVAQGVEQGEEKPAPHPSET